MKEQTEKPASDTPITAKRWKSYLTTSAAIAAGTAGAQGVIVLGETPATDMIDPVPDDDNPEVFEFGLLKNALGSFTTFLRFGTATASSEGFTETAPSALLFAGFSTPGATGPYFYASNTTYGEVIGGLTFGVPSGENGYLAIYGGYYSSQFLDTGGYVAFTFSTVEQGTFHGWAELSLISGAPENQYRLERYAFANETDNLRVGQTSSIPEPSSMASLALGAVGLLSWRRGRRRSE